MPEAATQMGKIQDAVHGMSKDMEMMDESSGHMSSALGSFLTNLLVIKGVMDVVNKTAAVSPMIRGFRDALLTLGKTRYELVEAHMRESAFVQKLIDSGLQSNQNVDRLLQRQFTLNGLFSRQLALETEVNKVGTLRLGILAGTVGVTARLFYLNQEFNESLIKANSDWKTRTELLYTNLSVVQQTGMSFRSVAEIQRELINYGLQTHHNYSEVLTTVVQLHEGLGMSVHAASELAVIAEQQLKVSFKDTADMVAQLVNETSLTADQVERMAKTLGPLMLAIQPKGAPAFPQIAKALGQYEDAVKRLGGIGDEFTQLMAKMMKPEGLLQAGVLGITDPRKLLEASGVKQAMESFRSYADQMLGSSGGMDRIQRMQMLADTFGTSYEQMSLMVEAAKNANTQLGTEATLQERFRDQMQAAGKGLERLYNGLTSLLQRALYPVVLGVNWLANAIATLLGTIAKWRPAVYAATLAVGIGIGAVVWQLKKAAVAFWEVVVAAKIAAESLKQYATQQALQSASKLLGGGGMAQSELAMGNVGRKLATSFGGQFSTVARDFGTTLTKSWKPTAMSFSWKNLLFGEKNQLELELGGKSLSFFGRLWTLTKTALTPMSGGLLAGLKTLGGTLGRVFLGGFSLVLRGLTLLFSPLGLLVAAVSALAFIGYKIWKVNHDSLEAQKLAGVRLAEMKDKLVAKHETALYMAARSGSAERTQSIYKKLIDDVRLKAESDGKSKAEIIALQATASARAEKMVGLAQYTRSSFEKLNQTASERAHDSQVNAEVRNYLRAGTHDLISKGRAALQVEQRPKTAREEQADYLATRRFDYHARENLDVQNKIADNTKKLNDETKKAQAEEAHRAELLRQQQEMMYLRDGGVIGRQMRAMYGYP